MNVDIVKAKSGWLVHPRKGAPREFDDAYETEPLFGPADDGECIDWCEQNGHSFRHRQQAALISPHFFTDLEKRCDTWLKELNGFAKTCGCKLVTDATYRASAAWKEEPTHYCYMSDFGGIAELERDTSPEATDIVRQLPLGAATEAESNATVYLDRLFGASQAVWELGFILTFDKDGKHTIFDKRVQWVTLDEEEF